MVQKICAHLDFRGIKLNVWSLLPVDNLPVSSPKRTATYFISGCSERNSAKTFAQEPYVWTGDPRRWLTYLSVYNRSSYVLFICPLLPLASTHRSNFKSDCSFIDVRTQPRLTCSASSLKRAYESLIAIETMRTPKPANAFKNPVDRQICKTWD